MDTKRLLMPGLQSAPKMTTRSELLSEGLYLVPFLLLVDFPAENSPVPPSSFKAKQFQRLCTLKAPACSQCVDVGSMCPATVLSGKCLHAALPPAVPMCWRWVEQSSHCCQWEVVTCNTAPCCACMLEVCCQGGRQIPGIATVQS